MLDPNTFLTLLYVLADDFCKSQEPPPGGLLPLVCRLQRLYRAAVGPPQLVLCRPDELVVLSYFTPRV